VSAGRVVEDNAGRSESDVVLQSTIWRWRWHVFADWRRSRYVLQDREQRIPAAHKYCLSYWRGQDLMQSSTRSTPKHFSLWWVHL